MPRQHLAIQAKMVEAPGTAPGSALLIPQHVYRHSWNSSPINIVVLVLVSKNSFDFCAVSANSSVEKSTFFLLGHAISIDYQLA